MLNDGQINARIRSLNENQIEIFDIVLDWGQFIQNSKYNNPTHFEPIRMFLRSAGGAGKYHLIKCICNCLSKNLVYNGEELEKLLYVYLIIFDEISLVSPKFLLNINNYFKFSEQ